MSKPFWIVAPMVVPENPRVPRVGQAQPINTLMDPGRRPARREGQVQPADEGIAELNAGYGYAPDPTWSKKITHVFTSQSAADAFAKEQAEKNPKTLFGVFGVNTVYETTTPQIITKQYNGDGELVTK